MNRLMTSAAVAALVAGAFAQSFTESFEGVVASGTASSGTLVADQTWTYINRSSPVGTVGWFAGNPAVFPAHQGTGYAGVNFNSVAGANLINNWLFSPVVTFQNGDLISFFARQVAGNVFPDRLRLRLGLNGASTDAADYSTVLLTINPNLTNTGFPDVWTEFTATVSGLSGPTPGRIAFHYDVPDGGPAGNNSNYIGIDTITYEAVPEPATLAALGLGALAVMRRRRKS
ncbi:MAG: choice-of-anchor J domain-containing protein [Fimbriimonadaceae bacterium]